MKFLKHITIFFPYVGYYPVNSSTVVSAGNAGHYSLRITGLSD